jgi:hypothetical protein
VTRLAHTHKKWKNKLELDYRKKKKKLGFTPNKTKDRGKRTKQDRNM